MSGEYIFLMRFVRTDVSEGNLLRHHTKKEIEDNLRDGFIQIVRTHEDGEPVYGITEKGRLKRDS